MARLKTGLKLLLLAAISRMLRIAGKGMKVRGHRWIIGGDRRLALEGNSLYFYRHVIRQHPEVDLVWISRSRACVRQARAFGGRAFTNFSPRGLWHVLTSRVYLFSIDPSDIAFVDSRRTLVVNLWHGMPMKKIAFDAMASRLQSTKPRSRLQHLSGAMGWPEVHFHVATSEFYRGILRSAFRAREVVVTGQARDDVLAPRPGRANESNRCKQGMGWAGRFVVTYLPTHRKFGRGARLPVLFGAREGEVRTRMGEKALIVTKNHSLMGEPKSVGKMNEHAVVEIERNAIETQQLLLASDVLVTDYSSVFVDYLLLDRPILFLWADDYAQEDNELYYDAEELMPGLVVRSEDALLDALTEIAQGIDRGVEKRVALRERYQAFDDGQNSERIMRVVQERLTGGGANENV